MLTEGTSEQRYIRATIDGTRRAVRSCQITTDPQTLPPETTWALMPNLSGQIEQTVGTTCGLRTGGEDGFKHANDDLGGADERLTDSASMERWWELVRSADPLVSVHSLADAAHDQPSPTPQPAPAASARSGPVSADRLPADPSRLGGRHRRETPAQYPAPAASAVGLFLPTLPLARARAAPARSRYPGRPRRPRLPRQHLPLGSPNMTDEGSGASGKLG